MRICVIGKYPPIQGGVSMRTYRAAHALAQRGHEVHVVTNAKEATAPFLMHMRPQDWDRCDARYDLGSVRVHWTEPADRSQYHVPMASPFVSKLATLAANAHAERPFDVIYSHYLEPYGVAGHLASQMLGVPHVVRTAGSDAGRLWHHPQLESIYDHVLRSAEAVVATGSVADRAVTRGVRPERIAYGGQLALSDDLFTPIGPPLDLAALRAEMGPESELHDMWWGDFDGTCPHFGIYGKLGDSKGSFALLDALKRLKSAGLEIGLVAIAHGRPQIERRFRARAKKLGLVDRILQVPFLPHWRIPEFLRGCTAVCCLEQDFPIGFHSPIVPFEVLLSGTCLVASTEVLTKLPGHGRLPHGYGCVAIADVEDVDELSSRLAAIAADPIPAGAIGARGRTFARELQRDVAFPETLEHVLEAAAARRPAATTTRSSGPSSISSIEDQFPLTRLGRKMLRRRGEDRLIAGGVVDLPLARRTLTALRDQVATGRKDLASLAAAIEIEISVTEAETAAPTAISLDALFRVKMQRWGIGAGDIASMVPVRNPTLCLLQFAFDVAPFMGIDTVEALPPAPQPGPSYIAAFVRSDDQLRPPLAIDPVTARILQLSDGTRLATSIAQQLAEEDKQSDLEVNIAWIEHLFVVGLLHLQEQHTDATADELA